MRHHLPMTVTLVPVFALAACSDIGLTYGKNSDGCTYVEGTPDEECPTNWYPDADGDGHGVHIDDCLQACDQPDGYVADSTDCDDEDPAVGRPAWYVDADGDGFGSVDETTTSCSQPDGFVSDASDCDDDNAAVNPEAPEVCDAIDNDCDGENPIPTWYRDVDDDGYGNSSGGTQTACEEPDGYAAAGDDCDDADPNVFPGAPELCDNQLNDCSTAWEPADEDGQVSYTVGTTITDLTSAFTGSPAYVTLPGEGTVTFCPGTYAVSMTAPASTSGEELYLRGHGGEVVLTGLGSVQVLVLEPRANVELLDITLQDGRGTTGGVLHIDEGTLRLERSKVTGGGAVDGGNIGCEGGALTLVDAEVVDGWADDNGGGVYASNCDVAVDHTSVDGNSAGGDGGGIYATGGDRLLSIRNGSGVSSNIAGVDGGGMWVNFDGASADVSIEDTQIHYNQAAGDGGGLMLWTPEVSGIVSLASIYDNEATQGGGMTVYESSLEMIDTEIQSNRAEYGGGILAYATELGASQSWSGVIVSSNTAGHGGGVWQQLGFSANEIQMLDDSRISLNESDSNCGGVHIESGLLTCLGDGGGNEGVMQNYAADNFGGVLLNSDSAQLESEVCDFQGNYTPDVTDVSVTITLTGEQYSYREDSTFSCSATCSSP